MSEKKITVLICDMPHARETRAVESLQISALVGSVNRELDVCQKHYDYVMGASHKPSTNGHKNGHEASNGHRGLAPAETVEKIPAGWIDSEQAAEILGLSRAGLFWNAKQGHLSVRRYKVPGQGAGSYFERSAVKALARERG